MHSRFAAGTLSAIYARMHAPSTTEKLATEPLASEQASAPASFKVVFRPPALTDTYVVTDPFVRVSPRLRTSETFSRDIMS
jgi:hypothetical protein